MSREGDRKGWILVAAAWGFAEATLFFVIPDVFLTWVGAQSLRRGLTACVAALGGALLGGALMYSWGVRDAAGALEIVERLPAISPAMIERVGDELAQSGTLAVMQGPIRGTPYKLYALRAPGAGIGWLDFLAITVPARLLRFVLLTLLAAGGASAASRSVSRRTIERTLIAGWVLFYAAYWGWFGSG